MPQYRYAYDRQGALVDVLALTRPDVSRVGPFACLGCGRELIARVRGEKREKNFAHKVPAAGGLTCNPETQLHQLAKRKFLDVYERCLADGQTFEVRLRCPVECCRHKDVIGTACRFTGYRTVDLTRHYDQVALERRDGAFIPDLLLFSKRHPQQKLYVELAVTHTLSDAKHDSGERIIELVIQTENDLEIIESRLLTEATARFVNFPDAVRTARGDECHCESQYFRCLFIYRSRKTFLAEGTRHELLADGERLKNSLMYSRLVGPTEFPGLPSWLLMRQLLVEAWERGHRVENCFLCIYQGRNFHQYDETGKQQGPPIYCKFLKVRCESNRAVECLHFQRDWGRLRQERSRRLLPVQLCSAPERGQDDRNTRSPSVASEPQEVAKSLLSPPEVALAIEEIRRRWHEVRPCVKTQYEDIVAAADPVEWRPPNLILQFDDRQLCQESWWATIRSDIEAALRRMFRVEMRILGVMKTED